MRCLLPLLLLLLLGCGARPTPPESPPLPFSLEDATATALPPQAPLQLIGHFRGEDEPALRAMLARFSEAEQVEVIYEGAERLPELLRARLEAGPPPDVIILPVPGWLPELAAAGAIPPLPDATAASVRAHFGPAWVELASHEGTLYGIPLDANAKSLLWYRPDALATALTPPQSLADLTALARSLEARGQPAFAVAGGAGWPLTDWFESVLLASAGPEVYDDLIHHRRAWSDPAVQRAAEHFVALLAEGRVLGGAEGAATLPLTPESFARAFDPQAPGAAFWLGQGSVVGALAGEQREGFELFPFPANGGLIGGGSLVVATNQRPETQALLHFLAQPEAVEPWVRQGGFISPNRDVPLSAYPSSLARHEATLLVDARLFRYDLSDRLPPKLGQEFLPEQLRQMVRDPEQIPAILAAIEQVATREQGAP